MPAVGWPAFAIHEETLVNRTLTKIVRKLQGKYGFKRFLRDGYGTVLEDKNRKYYKPAEIKVPVFDCLEKDNARFEDAQMNPFIYFMTELEKILNNQCAFITVFFFQNVE